MSHGPIEAWTIRDSTDKAYAYNLQGKLRESIQTDYANNLPTSRERVVYSYDAAGNVVRVLHETDSDFNGVLDKTTTTVNLIDQQNLTGYAQILTEKITDNSPAPQAPITRTFVLGADIVSQATKINSVSTSLFFQSDAQGSTRLISNLSGQIVVAHNYDAYGNLITPPRAIAN